MPKIKSLYQNSLPEKTRISVSFNYNGNYISKSELAPKLGYQVDLRKHKGRQVADKTVAYFDIDGRLLQANENYKFKGEERQRGRKKGKRKKKDLEDCFDFIYPFTFTMPDASKLRLLMQKDGILLKLGMRQILKNRIDLHLFIH